MTWCYNAKQYLQLKVVNIYQLKKQVTVSIWL